MPSHFPDHWREPLISSTILQLVPGKTESTTIALLAKLAGLLEPLREFLKTKPVWGSCAGAILMSRAVENAKKGGQELLGGVSVNTLRNGWGSQVIFLYTTFTSGFFTCFGQVESFEAQLYVEHLRDPERKFPGLFIRAPVSFPDFSVVFHTKVVSRSSPHSAILRTTHQSKSYPGYQKNSSHPISAKMQVYGK